EIRYDVRNAHYDAYQRDIRHIEYRAADKAQDAYDGRVNQLAAEEAHEHLVDKGEAAHDALGVVRRQDAVYDALYLAAELLLVVQQVAGHDDGYEDVQHHAEYAEQAV